MIARIARLEGLDCHTDGGRAVRVDEMDQYRSLGIQDDEPLVVVDPRPEPVGGRAETSRAERDERELTRKADLEPPACRRGGQPDSAELYIDPTDAGSSRRRAEVQSHRLRPAVEDHLTGNSPGRTGRREPRRNLR
jgi:hypothetical protein